MPRINVQKLNAEQEFQKKRWAAIDKLAIQAGFDDDALAYTEFSLLPFFELIVEECAKVAEEQARAYDGSDSTGNGCHRAAGAVRTFGKRIGNP